MRLLALAVLLQAALAGASWAQDTDRPRVYLGLRGGESNPLVDAHDQAGFSLGANLGRHLGAELAVDFYELELEAGRHGHIGEYGVATLVPQLRVRYPFLDGRLVPYAVGGIGVAFTDFNDRKPRGAGLAVRTEDTALVGVVGAGVEYFVADNVAIGLEGKYLLARDQKVTVDGARYDVDLDTGLISLGYRVFYPETTPRRVDDPRIAGATRVFFGVRVGGAIPVKDRPFEGIEARPEPSAWGGEVDPLYGVSVGANVGRHWGVELIFEGFEMVLARPGVGSLTEYAVYTLVPHLRLRYPLLGGRLEPSLLAGVGASWAEDNDAKPRGAGMDIRATDWDVVGSLGAGVEYFVASTVALGFEARYLISRGHRLGIDGGSARTGTLDTVLLAVTLRTFLWQSARP